MYRTALIFGTFDGIHAGHIAFITSAKKRAEKLVVVVARDETVEKIKGKTPIHSQVERADILSNLKSIDEVKIGNTGDKFAIVKEIDPDVIVLGYDQEAFVDVLKEGINTNNLNIDIQRAEAYESQRLKSGKLRDRYQDTKPL